MQPHTCATRVAVIRLILMLLVIAVPGLASTDRSADARVPPGAAPAATATADVDARVAATPTSAFDAAGWMDADRGDVEPAVFELALQATAAAVERGAADEPATLTVIDFSRPSTSRRMWVYDLRTRTLLFEEHVAHGRNSGHNMTRTFSNEPDSHKSSLGLFRAAEGYIGKHGYSVRLDGLEQGFNDRARARAIVIHGAEYVNGALAKAQGRLGRSLGCPAVRPEIADELIDAVRDGGLVFAYYPDEAWLSASTYLNRRRGPHSPTPATAVAP